MLLHASRWPSQAYLHLLKDAGLNEVLSCSILHVCISLCLLLQHDLKGRGRN